MVHDNIADNKITIYDKGLDLRVRVGNNMEYNHPDCIQNVMKYMTGPSHTKNILKALSQ